MDRRGMVIALDASSTCWYLARQLPDIDLRLYQQPADLPGAQQAREHSAYLLRRYAPAKIRLLRQRVVISQLKALEIDLFIFSCEGIDSDGALWDSNTVNAEFKSLLLKRASQSLLLIDKSKFNRSGEARIGHLDDVTHIVSDVSQS